MKLKIVWNDDTQDIITINGVNKLKMYHMLENSPDVKEFSVSVETTGMKDTTIKVDPVKNYRKWV